MVKYISVLKMKVNVYGLSGRDQAKNSTSQTYQMFKFEYLLAFIFKAEPGNIAAASYCIAK